MPQSGVIVAQNRYAGDWFDDPNPGRRVTPPPKGHVVGRSTGRGWPGDSPQNSQIELITLKLLRTVCGLDGVAPPLNCGNAPIQTLKRNVDGLFEALRSFAVHGL